MPTTSPVAGEGCGANAHAMVTDHFRTDDRRIVQVVGIPSRELGMALSAACL